MMHFAARSFFTQMPNTIPRMRAANRFLYQAGLYGRNRSDVPAEEGVRTASLPLVSLEITRGRFAIPRAAVYSDLGLWDRIELPLHQQVRSAADCSTTTADSTLNRLDKKRKTLPHHHCDRADVDKLLLSLVPEAQKLAKAPISSFPVGAVGLGSSGRIFVGVNVEFPQLPLGQSIHAEQCLALNALLHSEPSLEAIALSAAPCGHCRQFYCELFGASNIRFLFGKEPHAVLHDLLPERFGPEDLLQDRQEPLFLEQRQNGLVLGEESWGCLKSSDDVALIQAALNAANHSYAPYTRCPAGVALRTIHGRVHSGGYVESAAFNPSMPPLQAALVHGMVDGLKDWSQIVDGVLVELPEAKVQHAEVTKLVLSKIAPRTKLRVLHATWR